MAKYGNFVYGGAKYGLTPKLAYSVEDMSLLVLNFTEVEINWQSPTGAFSRIRLVRNQGGFPENSEDGVIIWDEFATEGNVSRSYFTDGQDNPTSIPLIPGRPIYYSMFLYTDQNIWVEAGRETDVIPSNHDSQKRLMDLIPKVYSSAVHSPTHVTDEVSTLYKFLDGISFTFEQFLTLLDLARPDHTREGLPYSLLRVQTDAIGLDQEPGLPVKNRKRLIREGLYLYKHKGLSNGLGTYVESLTGWAPTVTVSPNLLLDFQDSTFYQSIGRWTATNATLTSSTAMVPTTSTVNQIDNVYTCSVVASSAGVMSLGTSLPITKKIPVTSAKTYIASAGIKRPTGSGTITPTVKYYDRDNTLLYSKSGTAASAGNAWSVTSVSALVPAYQLKFISGAVGASGNVVYTTTATHSWVVGSVVNITGFTTTAVNLTNAVVTAVTGTTFTVANGYTGTATGSGQVVTLEGCYAAIELAYSTSGTYYIDQVCLQEGSSVNYDEARAITVLVEPNKINYIKNPSFEVDDSTWTRSNSTFLQDTSVPTYGYAGAKSGKFTNSGTWSITTNYNIPITAGQYYTFSAYMKASAAATVGVQIDFYNDANTLVESVSGTTSIGTTYEQFSITGLTDSTSGATYAKAIIYGSFSSVLFVDLVQFEKSPVVTEYFDGSMPSQYGVIWQGTADASYSLNYFNKPFKAPRLAKTMKDWIPPNTWWRIKTLAGLEYTNFTV